MHGADKYSNDKALYASVFNMEEVRNILRNVFDAVRNGFTKITRLLTPGNVISYVSKRIRQIILLLSII